LRREAEKEVDGREIVGKEDFVRCFNVFVEFFSA
jgi:hypothetical protein